MISQNLRDFVSQFEKELNVDNITEKTLIRKKLIEVIEYFVEYTDINFFDLVNIDSHKDLLNAKDFLKLTINKVFMLNKVNNSLKLSYVTSKNTKYINIVELGNVSYRVNVEVNSSLSKSEELSIMKVFYDLYFKSASNEDMTIQERYLLAELLERVELSKVKFFSQSNKADSLSDITKKLYGLSEDTEVNESLSNFVSSLISYFDYFVETSNKGRLLRDLIAL